jgi:DUF4097 and DUF4098 domain-containing protein YvlB
VVALALTCAVTLSGCVVGGMGDLVGRATDESTQTFPLTAGGTVHIRNTNGKVEIEGVSGSTVEVRAVRIAKAATDDAARQLLPRISIKQDIRPDLVSFETESISGFMIGARTEVQYYVKAPKGAVVEARSTNGQLTLTGIAGAVTAHTTNGAIRGVDLSGGVDASVTNGAVSLDLAALGADKIRLSATNGGVTLLLPETAKADLSASCTNGGISVTGVKLDISQETRRHIEGKINGGGTPIELKTTNGGVRVRARSAA